MRAPRPLLALGVLQLAGAALWCLAGAGLYGSPFAGMEGGDLTKVAAFLALGPLSALPAAILAASRPKWAGLWLVSGGLASAFLILFVIPHPDLRGHLHFETAIPLALVSLPMLVAGAWVLLRGATRDPSATR